MFLLLLSILNADASRLSDFCRKLFSSGAAGSVFINFAKNHLGENFSNEMGNQWEKKIRSSLKGWTEEEAKNFIVYLETRIGQRNTIRSIKHYSFYFSVSGFRKFMDTVSFYEDIIGEDAVTKHLKRSLKGFFYEAPLSNLEQVVEFVRSYIEEDTVQESSRHKFESLDWKSEGMNDNPSQKNEKTVSKDLIAKSLGDLSQIHIIYLKQAVKFIEQLIGREEVKKKMGEDFRYFSRTWTKSKLQKLHKNIVGPNQTLPDPFDSWFEARVFHRIAGRGYWVIPQYEVSKYKIDMIIIGFKGKLAVECDGERWHSGKRKEQDHIRQQYLEQWGWKFWRVSDRDFNNNERIALGNLWKRLGEMQIYPLKHWKTDKKPSLLRRFLGD